MKASTRHIKEGFIGQSKTKSATQKNKPGKHDIKSFDFFAIKPSHDAVRRFTLLFRDGQRLSVPYAFLPLIKLDQNGQIEITTGELCIRIMGRGLIELEKWLSEEKVIWIKESDSGQDDEQGALFITSIETEDL